MYGSKFFKKYKVNFKIEDRENNDSKNNKKIRLTQEEKNLNIKLENEDPQKYKDRIYELVETLENTHGIVKISTVEAIILIEYFAEEISLDYKGTIIIDISVAKKFADTILRRPLEFITYLKAVEKKMDLNNPDSKIPLNEVLYMMRNARKFGLYLEDKKDSKNILEIKKAVIKSRATGVELNIVNIDRTNEIVHPTNNEILVNTYKPKNHKTTSTNTKQVENKKEKVVEQNVVEESDKVPELDETQTPTITSTFVPEMKTGTDELCTSVVKLDNGRVLVTTQDGVTIEKDDIMVYDIVYPDDEDDGTSNKKPSTKKSNTPIQVTTKEKTMIEDYILRFGELDRYELKNKSKFLFKDRSKINFFDEKITNYQGFNHSKLRQDCIIESEDTFIYLMSRVFDIENSLQTRNGLCIFIGDILLKNDKKLRFISADVHYLLLFIYLLLKREDRESFYNYVYAKDKLRIDNANTLLKNINSEFDIFYSDASGFISYAVYSYGKETIKTQIVRFKESTIVNLLENNDLFRDSYNSLKYKIDGLVKSNAFGKRAEEKSATTELKNSSFFRATFKESI